MMSIKSYKCKKCDFETSVRGWRNAQNEIDNHFCIHHKNIVNKIEESKRIQRIEIIKIEKKYPIIYLGEFIESVKSKLAKPWKCPRCKEEMGYGDKLYHERNAFRNDKEYKCVIKEKNKYD